MLDSELSESIQLECHEYISFDPNEKTRSSPCCTLQYFSVEEEKIEALYRSLRWRQPKTFFFSLSTFVNLFLALYPCSQSGKLVKARVLARERGSEKVQRGSGVTL